MLPKNNRKQPFISIISIYIAHIECIKRVTMADNRIQVSEIR